MNAKKLNYFKQLLLEKRREAIRDEGIWLALNAEHLGKMVKTGGTDRITNLAEVGSDTLLLEENSYFDERNSKYLQHLDAALARIEEGSYGYCLECGNKIPLQRLEAVPHTRYCLACKRQGENSESSLSPLKKENESWWPNAAFAMN
ncbi:MAG: RNA polymerase-binding transcription factor DksA [bacterium]|nr:RNA polymerase-binding transcription factor DksA [bacterium]